MRAARPVLAALLLLAPLPADAVEALLGWDSRLVWTSNVFRSETDEEDAWSLLNGPNLGLRKPQGDLRFDVKYSPRYEAFIDLSDANALEHFLVATGSWSVDRRTEVTLQNRFTRSSGLRELFETTGPDIEEGEVLINREETSRNDVLGAVSYQLSPRTSFSFSVNNLYYDYESDERGNDISYRVNGSLRRVFSRRQTAGFGFAASRFDSEETDFQPGSGTTIYEAFGIYDFLISRTLRFSLSAGPAFVMPDDFEFSDEQPAAQYRTTGIVQSTPPPPRLRASLADRSSCGSADPTSCATPALAFLAGTNTPAQVPGFALGLAPVEAVPVVGVPVEGSSPGVDSTLNLFGNVSLVYDHRPFSWSLGYTRRASNTSGTGTTTNLDVARLTGNWNVARRWRLGARATWQRQNSISEVPRATFLLSPTGATAFLDANFVTVSDPSLAVYEVRDVAEIGSVSFDAEDSEVDIISYNAGLTASHTLSENLTLQATASYWYQTSEGDVAEETDRQSVRFELGFTYSFDPISL